MTIITLELSPELKQKLRESIACRDTQSIQQLLEYRLCTNGRSIAGTNIYSIER
ncbi:MAG: hypothetical protein KME31_35970 [Tolypothrix carrinoi HA7290-LM1]|jgi:hypothetical protein|nr:hypothetical protein [Tolypothrix carrinoi HA7290-LM1]